MTGPLRNHVEMRSNRRPVRQYVSETHDHKPDAPRRAAIVKQAKRFAWGYENYAGGSDDWRCDAVREVDEFDDEIDDDRDPCECAECAGATVREWDHGKPSLSTRVKLNLARSGTE